MQKDYEKFKINKIITDDGVIRLKKPVKVSFQIKKNVDEVFKNAINRGMKTRILGCICIQKEEKIILNTVILDVIKHIHNLE